MPEPDNTQLYVVILAAGKGTRMFSALPKVLHKLAGNPMLDHVIRTAKSLKPEKICVVYGHGGELVPASVARDDLHFALQEPQLGTGHAVKTALPLLGESGCTLVLYGDVPLIKNTTLERLVKCSGTALLTVELDDPQGYGRIVRDTSGRIIKIAEEKDATPAERAIKEVNTGVLVAPTVDLKRWLSQLNNGNAQNEFYLTDIVSIAANEGVVIASEHPDQHWEVLGVNNKIQLADLERIYQREAAITLMKRGVGLADPERIDIRGELSCGTDVFIDVNCLFEGKIVLGSNVRIGANSILKDATIRDNTEIAPFSHIDGALIGSNCKIGPYARIRPETEVGDDAHIGNFVEIKNAIIDCGSKANHLSYIGDASIGKNVNIGAGTITCNYDGANKHRTIIEDDVFIGSDTQLIAPVTVGKGATIGAGSTIAKNAPEGGLTLSRAKQQHIDYWKRPTKKG